MTCSLLRRLGGIALFLLAGLALTGCEQPEQLEQADLVLTNGKIFTVDAGDSIASTLVVTDGHIVAVGGNDLAIRYAAATTIDLGGKTVLPGFVDSHTHIDGDALRYIDLREVTSIGEIKYLIREKATELGPGEWITGYGWSEDELEEGRRPLIGDLDQAAPGNPVTITRAGGHSAAVNSKALSIAGITKDTPDPDGGVIEHDENGELNGIIRERQGIVGEHVPAATYAELRASLIVNLRDQFRHGITSLTNASERIEGFKMWRDIYAEQSTTLPRASVQLRWEGREVMNSLRADFGDGDENLRIGPIKIFADGGFTGPAAYTSEPYVDQGDYRGYLRMPEEELRALIREIHDAGWQMGIHAIGDAAITITAEALSEAIDATPRDDHRHYLNHFSMRPSDETMQLMADHDVAITQQPNFTYTLEGRYVANLDGWRLEHNNPIRSPMDHGIFVAISSDVLPIGPKVGLYAAVTRKGMSGRAYGPDEAITIEEAIRAYTLNGAWLMGEEDIKGSIEPGKLADLIVLSEDVLTMDPERILELEVDQTWLGGELVFERQQ